MRLSIALVSLAFIPAAALAQTPAPAPAEGAESRPQEKKKAPAKPPIYDEKADARADIAKAVADAKKHEKRVLLQWGANWCGWCHLLHDVMKKDKDLAKEILYEYDVVLVDVNQGKNADLAKELGAKWTGIPYMTILGADGKVITHEDTEQFELADKTKPGHDPAKLMACLKKNEAKTSQASELYSSSLARAKEAKKTLLLKFSAPWCGYCHMMDRWMERPDVAPILGKEFVALTIDTERNAGGQAMLDEYSAKKSGGIPWFAFVDGEGKVVATSMGPKGNVGFPLEDHEIEHFMSMLKSARGHLDDADVAKIKETLLDEQRKYKNR